MQSLTVPATLDSLGAIREYVDVAARAGDLERRVAYRLRLAVDEIATNIIMHGYDEANLHGVVELRAELDEQSLTIFIEDTGAAYDPTEHACPDDMDLPLEEREAGGLGVFLAIKGVDEFRYERICDRNRHTFVVKRSAPSANE